MTQVEKTTVHSDGTFEWTPSKSLPEGEHTYTANTKIWNPAIGYQYGNHSETWNIALSQSDNQIPSIDSFVMHFHEVEAGESDNATHISAQASF